MANHKVINKQMNIMSAIAIILVVCGHEACGALTLSGLFPYYAYHLPVFVFISGYFYSSKAEASPWRYTLRNAKKCFSYFWAWQLIYACLMKVLNIFTGGMFSIPPQLSLQQIFISPILGGTYGLTAPNWYLIMLFFLLTSNVFLQKLFSFLKLKNRAVIIGLAFLGGYVGIRMANAGLNTGIFLRITQVLFFLPILLLGQLYKTHLEKYADRIPSSIYFAVIIVLQAALQCSGHFEAVSAWMNGFNLNPWKYYLYALNGIALLLRISKILAPAIGNHPAVLYLGRNTRTVMAHHLPCYFFIHLILYLLMPYCTILADFDVARFSRSVYYHYYPTGNSSLSVLYVIITTCLPLLFLKVWKTILNVVQNKWMSSSHNQVKASRNK